MAKIFLLILALAGCARIPEHGLVPVCLSPCGAMLYGSKDCDAFDLAEHHMLFAFKSRLNWEPKYVCAAFKGYSIWDREQDVWKEQSSGLMVEGVTYCGKNRMEIDRDDWQKSSYFHESAHVFECSLGLQEKTHEHQGWLEQGIYDAIDFAGNL